MKGTNVSVIIKTEQDRNGFQENAQTQPLLVVVKTAKEIPLNLIVVVTNVALQRTACGVTGVTGVYVTVHGVVGKRHGVAPAPHPHVLENTVLEMRANYWTVQKIVQKIIYLHYSSEKHVVQEKFR